MLGCRNSLFYLLPPILALAVFMTVNFKTDLSAFIIAGNNTEEILLASEMQSGTLSKRYLISVVSDEKKSVPKALLQNLIARLKTINGVEQVWIPGQQKKITQTLQSLYVQYANGLYSQEPEQDLAQVFSAEALAERAKMLKKALLSPQGTMIKKVALQDPLLLTLNGFQLLKNQMQKISVQDVSYQNLILETTMAGLDVPQQSRIQAEIKRAFNNLNLSELNQYQLEMTGVPVFAVATQTLIQGDITRISILSSVLLMVLFLLIFRSFSVLFQVFTLLAIVILSAILSTQLVFGYVHGMTVAIGSTLVGICIDYPIHAIAHVQAAQQEQKLSIIRKIWPSMLLGGITTMIGYIALGISGYPGFQQVAIYAVSGIIVSLGLTRFVLPRLKTQQNQRLKVPLVSFWMSFCKQFRPWLIALLIILVCLSFFSLKSLHWMQDMQELTPELDYLKQNDKRIRARMTSIEPGRFVLVTGENSEAALQKTEEVYPLLEKLKQTGSLTDYYGLYPWLLSAQQQRNNHAQLQHYLTEKNQFLWQQALKQQGLSIKHLGDLKYTSTTTLTLEQVFATPVKNLIDSRIISGDKQTIIMIWLAEHQPEAVKQALEKIEDAQYFSQRDMLNNMTQDYTETAKVLLLLGLALIILLMIIRYKSLLKTLQTLLPAVLAACLILATWSLSGAAVSFLHLVSFLLVVAICVDYGIFYQENRGGNLGLTYQAMAASMLTSALAFGSLLIAQSTSLRILAGVVALGVILGFLLCPIIIKIKSEK